MSAPREIETMFTVCPKCALTLVVTAADLRVAQGYVRCGRCSNVFNALARLSEDRQAAATAAQAQSPPPRPPEGPASKARQESNPSDRDAIPDDALEFNPNATDVTKVFVEQPPSPQFQAATGTFQAIRLEAEDSARAEEQRARDAQPQEAPADDFDPVDTQVDVEIDPDLLAAMAQLGTNRPAPHPEPAPVDSPAPQPAVTPPLKAIAPPRHSPPMQSAVDSRAQAVPQMPIAARAKARVDAARPSFESAQAIRAMLTSRKRTQSVDDGATAPTTPLHARWWAPGSALLGVLLAVQIVHHYRHDLAANAHLNGPLTSLYAALGVPLVPRWNLGAYEVRQLGASTGAEAPGQITVRASVKNGAQQSQPLPLLRVTLQDRFGNRIAARDVPPQSYLPRAIPGSSLLSAGQRIDAEMDFVDPGSNAVGFEIDACLPAPGGGIACANDAAR